MEIEFHYFITKGIALRADFNESQAEIIAHASQLTDDNVRQYCINRGKPNEFKNYISFTYNILKPRKTLLHIYSLFHFIPGDYKNAEKRTDKKIHPFNTTPDSKNARKILELAFNTLSLYRMGIAVHAFADTWAHQNFTGLFDEFNAMPGITASLSPNVGHSDAGVKPEYPACTWEDKRLVQPLIDNNKRFIHAAKRIFEEFCRFQGKTSDWFRREWKPLEKDLLECFGKQDPHHRLKNERIRQYKKILGVKAGYGKDLWFNEAVNTNLLFKPDYTKSNWFQFQKAVIAHQKDAFTVLGSLFKKTNQKNEWVSDL